MAHSVRTLTFSEQELTEYAQSATFIEFKTPSEKLLHLKFN